jgi:hypothetical protein
MMLIPLNIEQKEILDEALSRELRKKQKRFKKKRLSHFNNPKLKEIYEKYQVEISPVLYTIKFTCYFSFYLYIILKSQVKFMDWVDMPYYYRIAISQDVNINKLHYETGICRNTIRKAFRELVKLRMIEITDYCKPEHKSCKSILVLNDYYIHSYCPELGYVTYSSEIPFNYFNNPKNN